jgi:signal transduction histidine kinase
MASPEKTTIPRPPFLHRVSRRQWVVVDVAVAALLFLGGLSSLIWNGHRLPDHFALLVLALCLATIPLPFRRQYPVPALVLVTAGLVLGTLLGQGLAGTPVLALTLYTVASQCDRRASLLAAGLTTVAFLAAVGIAHLGTWSDGNVAWYDATDNIIAVAIAWVLGDSVRSRRAFAAGSALQAEQRRRFEAERAQKSITEERLHIARELHDIVAHSLSVIAIQSGVGRHVLDTQPEEARKALAAIETTSRSALTDLRWVLGVLRSNDPDGPSLDPAPGMADIDRLLGECRAAGLEVSYHQSGQAIPLTPSMDLCLYRIVQEALTNVTKHAGTAQAAVDVTYEVAAVAVSVVDEGALHRNGAVLPADQDHEAKAHHGIVGMRERTAMYGGTLIARPRSGGGFEVQARLPISSAHP